MVVGDSLTWGAGLAENERFTNIAEDLLRQKFSERSIEVLNFGVSGTATVHQYEFLKDLLPKVNPDLVVIAFCMNDTQTKNQDFSVERDKYSNVIFSISALSYSLGLHEIATVTSTGLFRVLEIFSFIPTWQEALNRTYDPSSSEWLQFKDALLKIDGLVESSTRSTPIFYTLVQSPTFRPIDFAHPDADMALFLTWYEKVKAVAASVGFSILDPHKELMEAGPVSGTLNPLDGHPNSGMNKVYGSVLATKLESILRQEHLRQ
jgi:hypothetical protein